jgi:Lrp/AsnC family leucine-responsive transcriptional regulator
MDDIDRIILSALARNARSSLAEIGTAAGLSPSAVNERIRRLVEAGTIVRFTVEAAPAPLGLPLVAFVSVELAPGADEAAFRAFAAASEAVEECHHVTGRWSYLLKVRTASLDGVEAFLLALKERRLVARSETALALSSPVAGTYVPRGEPDGVRR